MGGAVKSVKKGIGGIGSTLGGAKDLIFGGKDPGVKDRFTPLDPLQRKALDKYGSLLGESPEKMAGTLVENQEKQIRATAGDSARKAQELVAQRGLGSSSVGLNAILGASRDMGDKLGAARAQLPLLAHDLKINNLNSASRGIQDILGSRAFIQGTPSTGRSGGLLGIGLGAAAAYGAARSGGDPGAGFQAGMGAGKGIANLR
jgi:hypothetical protein